MKSFLYSFVIATGLAAVSDSAIAATESFEFDATLTSGTLLCGPEGVGSEVPCPELFGVIDGPGRTDDLMVGLMVGGTYPGRIDLIYDRTSRGDLALSDATCHLNGKDCRYSLDFIPIGAAPMGSTPGRIDFSETSVVTSLFIIDGVDDRYNYATDYLFRGDEFLYYYTDVNFELSNTEFTPVPLRPLSR